jgi:hypothetical protein
MTRSDEQPMVDDVTLSAIEAHVYEAIATLEFLGYPVTISDIVTATNLDEDTALKMLPALIERRLLRAEKRDGEPVYVPAHRGWSAAPERAANPKR